MRDINLGDTIYPKFTTRAFATGIPTTLAGTPVLSVYEENNLTQITAGVSVSVDYDSVTGLNQATIVATSGNGYEAGKSYDLVITTGTVGGVSVVGEVVYSFTVEDTTALMPTTAGRTLDVNANGEAGLDLDNTSGTLATAQFAADFLTAGLIADNAFVAANFAANSLDGKGDWNIGKTGYSISGTKTTLDALNDIAATAIVSAGAITTLSGAVVNVDTVDTCTTNSDMRGTDNAATAAALAVAQLDLDTITGPDGALLASTQGATTWGAVSITVSGASNNITLTGSGTGDGLVFSRSGSGGLFGTNWAAAIESEVTDALTAYGASTHAAADVAALLNDISSADVLTQVNAALDTAIAELGVAAPTATPTLRTGLMLLYMMARNRVDVDTTGTDAMKIYNDAGAQIASKVITDDGTDYSEAEMS